MTTVGSSAGPAARSSDGRTFRYTGAETFPIVPGDLVLLRGADGRRTLGQVLDCGDTGDPEDGGSGVLLGLPGEDGTLRAAPPAPFQESAVEPVSEQQLEHLTTSVGATLPVGWWRVAGHRVVARLRPDGFNRHTFLCGQSGSGKTYALGVLLERLLLGTGLRMVVLDPNADFVGLGRPRAGTPPDLAERVAATDVRVLGATSTGREPLRLRFRTMNRRAQAALLMLDPLADREEYNLLLHRMDALASPDLLEALHRLLAGTSQERALGQRIENLGLAEWEVWAGPLVSAAEVIASGARATVLDLSGFGDPLEPLAVSLDVVESLWAARHERTPTLVVIDEAHNLCPAEPAGTIEQALVDRLTQIAAEGRKYGLWLVLSTQRPDKLQRQVISQCDNLALMRMNSPADVADLTRLFGFAPPAMLRSAPYFRQGEALFAGSFVSVPSFVTMGERFTVEGGADVRVPMAPTG